MRRLPFAAILLAGLIVTVTGCSSSSSPATQPREEPRPRAALEFRLVHSRGATPLIIPATPAVTGPGGRSCTALVTASDKRPAPPAREEVIFDRKRENCYMLGPALLTGDRVDEASAVYDDQTSQWVVTVHFSNEDFVTRVAAPNLHRIIAIVLDGVVQAAPEINPGITGRDVQISGDYSRSEATAIAASLR